jgi:hypothetical protein
MRWVVSFAVLAAALVTASDARADDPPKTDDSAFTKLVHDLSAGRDLLRTVPSIAVFDGGYSLTLQIGSALASGRWHAPILRGLVAHEATRVLYGTSWTAMLGLESLAAVVVSGTRFDWLGEATYRTDWIFGISAPGCPHRGAYGGCGIGIGGFGGLHVRPLGSHVWYEVGGGWIEQRVANDERRTLSESAWVMTPLAAAYEVKTDLDAPIALRLQAGPGVYFGMHNAHVHPTELGTRMGVDPPWHEIYPLDAGAGPGGRAELRLIFARHLSLDGELVMAPFLLGGPTHDPPKDVAPLDSPRGGTSTWRYVGVGASWDHASVLPMRAGVSFFGAELSGRPVTKLGHQGVMLRFEFPLRLAEARLPRAP